MKTAQIHKVDEMETEVILQSSESIQVGFTTDKSTLLQIVKSVECMSEDATFVISEEGLMYRGMDPSHVSMIDLSIPNRCFEKWSCIAEQKFGLNIAEFRKMISSLDTKGSITLVIEKDEIKISQNGFSAAINTIDPSATDCPLPKIPYDSCITFAENQEITSMEFRKLAQKFATVSDFITINCDNSRVKFSGKGDRGECSNEFTKDQCEIRVHEDSETTYNLEYLIPYLKTLTKDSEVVLEFSQTKPMRMRTKVNNLGRIDFYLAPRVEN